MWVSMSGSWPSSRGFSSWSAGRYSRSFQYCQLVDREPGRVERLEALVREARKWIVEGAWDVESGNQWVERAATLVPVEAADA